MKESKIGLWSLTALVFSSMVGAGIFSLPQNMAEVAGARAVLIGWGVTGVGILALAASFLYLSRLKTGSRWRHLQLCPRRLWRSGGLLLRLGLLALRHHRRGGLSGDRLRGAGQLSSIPLTDVWFGDGNTLAAFIGESCILWAVHLLVARGVQQAALFNLVATLAKSLPLLLFILFACYWFDPVTFAADQQGSTLAVPVSEQVRNTMLITLWVFTGIEGAAVLGPGEKQAGRGHGHRAGGGAGAAALCAHLGAGARDIESPRARGPAQPLHGGADGPDDGLLGKVLISVGLIVSVLASYVSWTLFSAEVPFSAARHGRLPGHLPARRTATAPP